MLYLHKLPAFIFLAFILIGCAHPVSPGGGPKDKQPPQVLKSIPENGSTHFTGNKFTIEFDEFINLNNISAENLISPPVKKQPDFKVKGKSLQVKFQEALLPNTTYSVYFGDAIVDITEKNPLSNYTYIFSTGDYVDSLSMQGEVIDAYSLEPVEDAFVMLYKDNNDTLSFDSLPLAVRPYYLSKTDVNGKFRFNGLANEKYLLFALTDMNRNYIFDQPSEAIAFLDTLAVPQYLGLPTGSAKTVDSVVTIVADSVVAIVVDSSQANLDSLLSEDFATEKNTNYELYLFMQEDTVQKLLKAGLLRPNTLRFSFSLPATNIRFMPLNFDLDSSWFKSEFSAEKDTVTWYLKTLPVDTLELLIFNDLDTLEQVNLRLTSKDKSKGKKKKNEEEVKQYLKWSTNVKKRTLTLDQKLEINFDQPIVSHFTDSAWLATLKEDTIYNPPFYFIDSLRRKIHVPLQLVEESNYSVYFPDSAFIDWNGLHNEAIFMEVFTKSLKEYGIFTIKFFPVKNQKYILQLLGKEEVISRQHFFQGDTTIVYNYINPGKYLLKLIFDDNNNGKWDPGNYLLKQQPEKIMYFMKEINVRANWEIEEEWGF